MTIHLFNGERVLFASNSKVLATPTTSCRFGPNWLSTHKILDLVEEADSDSEAAGGLAGL